MKNEKYEMTNGKALLLLLANASRRANNRQLPIIYRSFLDVEVTGEKGKPLSFGSFPDHEPVFEVVRWNRLVVERDAHGHSRAGAGVKWNAIDDPVGARCP